MFISLEGIDGAGKTTVARKVASDLVLGGTPAIFVEKRQLRTDNTIVRQHAGHLEKAIWKYPHSFPTYDISDDHWIRLVSAWYCLLDEAVVRPHVAAGKVTIIDGWCSKTIEKFTLKAAVRRDFAESLFSGLSEPDIAFFLRVQPEVAAARKKQFSMSECGITSAKSTPSKSLFLSFQEKLYARLAQRATERNWVPIAPEGTASEVARNIGHLIKAELAPPNRENQERPEHY